MACFQAILQLMLNIHALKLAPCGEVTDARSKRATGMLVLAELISEGR
jgi:hypothetical protein